MTFGACLAENLAALEVCIALQPSIPFDKGIWENKEITVYYAYIMTV